MLPLKARPTARESLPEILVNRSSEPLDRQPAWSDVEEAVVRAIRRARQTATSPLEVYRTALARVTPLLHADFASVFLRDEEQPQLLRLACAQNWPQSSARFLSRLRIREGRGPTGQAVAQASPIEVVDVFEDPDLMDWWEPARELGFVSMTAHPLVTAAGVLGSISFYFSEPQPFDDRERALLETAAREMARAAEKVGQAPTED